MSTGYNGAPPGMPHCTQAGCDIPDPQTFVGCQRAIHAEANALAFSARHGVRTEGAAMYSTCATCLPCAQILVSAGIAKFVYLEHYRLEEGLELLEEANVEVIRWSE